jgi:hypothetical protein
MSKIKVVLLLILVGLLVDFAVENALLSPDLKLLRFELGRLPIFLLAYGCLALGLLIGWLGHVLRVKRQKKAALLAAGPEAPGAPQEQQH